jgi:hypothetical protein
VYVELGVHVAQVVADRLDTEYEPTGDVLVGEPFADETDHDLLLGA